MTNRSDNVKRETEFFSDFSGRPSPVRNRRGRLQSDTQIEASNIPAEGVFSKVEF